MEQALRTYWQHSDSNCSWFLRSLFIYSNQCRVIYNTKRLAFTGSIDKGIVHVPAQAFNKCPCKHFFKNIPSAMSSLDACEKQASFLAFNWISLSLAVFRVPVCPSSSHSPEIPPNRWLVLSAPSKAGTFFVSLPIAHTVALDGWFHSPGIYPSGRLRIPPVRNIRRIQVSLPPCWHLSACCRLCLSEVFSEFIHGIENHCCLSSQFVSIKHPPEWFWYGFCYRSFWFFNRRYSFLWCN